MARKKTNLVNDALEYLKDKILSYEYKPGSQLSDSKIAFDMSDELNMKISRSPVREALMFLQSDGLVELINDKVCVTRITERDVCEIFQVRDAIEQQATIIVINNGGFSEFQLEQLTQYQNRLQSLKGKTNVLNEYLADDDFHTFLVACTENNRLMEISNRMTTQIKRVRWLKILFPDRRIEANNEHNEILTALQKNDKERALHAIHLHNTNIQKNFHRIFESEELIMTIANIVNEK